MKPKFRIGDRVKSSHNNRIYIVLHALKGCFCMYYELYSEGRNYGYASENALRKVIINLPTNIKTI
jgi:hypothetical protein